MNNILKNINRKSHCGVRLPCRIISITTVALTLLLQGVAYSQNWQLVWADDFNGSISSDWSFETGGGGWGNNEQEYYQPQNATIVNYQGLNCLAITAKQESVGGYNYTSARMKTQGHKSWKYGKIIASIALPSFSGSWPAFWMLGDNIGSVGWPTCGELDIMEQINTDQTIHGSTHWNSGGQADWTSAAGTSITAFHEYSITWDANYIKWYIDGNQYSQFYIDGNSGGTDAFNNNNFFIILNEAVGGNWPGFNIDNNALPATMYVDWVRVYQDGATPALQIPNFVIVNRNSGKCLDLSNGNMANGTILQQWDIDPNTGDQRWSLLPTEGGNHFKIISWASGKCESVAGDSLNQGAKIQEWDYVGNDDGQQFDLVDAGNGWFYIKNVKSGLVLDVTGAQTTNGTPIQQWPANGTAAQLWRLQPWGNYFIRSQVSGRYLYAQGGGTANGTQVGRHGGSILQWQHGHAERPHHGSDQRNETIGLQHPDCFHHDGPGQRGLHLWGLYIMQRRQLCWPLQLRVVAEPMQGFAIERQSD
jgi:beta-glucanase (GH16 family)